ncbi:uncharacterized protein [Rutidosis leptorrhynchoides]|uniref:uncharacterized protein n=1 Tax=Rutidosis leptorrhynchoides TaxID=125765 RepID=UPI003A9999C6
MTVNVNGDDQELEALETLSLTDFPLTEAQDHLQRNPSSSTNEDLFEFFKGEPSGFLEQDKMIMSHAEDMISEGKLVPINDQTQTRKTKKVHQRRSESMRELKSTNNKGTVSQLVRNCHSLDYKKLSRKSKMNYDSTAEIHRNSLSNKSSSSRWTDLKLGPLRVPQEMDLKDIRNRQIVLNTTSKSLFPKGECNDRFSVTRVGGHQRKTSWGVLGILSCKSSVSVAVTMPIS